MSNAYAAALAAKLDAKFDGYQVTVEQGRKYARLVIESNKFGPDPYSRSAHAFVDGEGNVYKTAGWKSPAKGVRYNVATAEQLAEAVRVADPFGGYLYR